VPVAVALSWTTFIHANFNAPSNASISSFSNMMFYQLNGGGHYLASLLAVLIFVFAVLFRDKP